MDAVCMSDLKILTAKEQGAHISIFMPTHRAGGASQEDVIRFKNLLRQAEEGLIAQGMRSPEAKALLRQTQALLNDNLFWRHQSDGLSVFVNPNSFLYYHVPIDLQEVVVVGDRFHIKPLIPLLAGCGVFYFLAISQKEVRLIQCTRYGSARLKLEGVPKNLAEALQSETPDARVEYHAAGTSAGGQAAIYHGAGLSPNYDKDNILHYFQQVDKGVHKALREERSPLVLAAVDFLVPLYRKANNYHGLLSEGVQGNPDEWSDDRLREQAWAIVGPYFARSEADAVAQYRKDAGTGKTSNEVKEVALAANQGRVRFLFVASGVQKWGRVDPDNNTVTLHTIAEPGDEDLLDYAALHTLLNDGTIYIMELAKVPDGAPLAAVFRY